MFGAVNALFSGLAFAGIIYTILLQKEELSAQRKELRLSRKEFKIQNRTLKQQRLENTFFNLLSQHNEIIRLIDVQMVRDGTKGGVIAHGRDCFKNFYEQYVKEVQNHLERNRVPSMALDPKDFNGRVARGF